MLRIICICKQLFQRFGFLTSGDVYNFAAPEFDADRFTDRTERWMRNAAINKDHTVTASVDSADGTFHVRREAHITGIPAQCVCGNRLSPIDTGSEVTPALCGNLDVTAAQPLRCAVYQRNQCLEVCDQASFREHSHIIVCTVDITCAIGTGGAARLCIGNGKARYTEDHISFHHRRANQCGWLLTMRYLRWHHDHAAVWKFCCVIPQCHCHGKTFRIGYNQYFLFFFAMRNVT